MAIQLVVKHPFADFETGDHITDPVEVAKWGASHPEYVVRKALDEPVKPVAPAAPAPAPTVAS